MMTMMMMFSTFLSQVVGPMWLRNKRVRLLSCNQVHVYTPVQLHLMHPESLLESIFDGKLMPSPRLPSLYDAVVGKSLNHPEFRHTCPQENQQMTTSLHQTQKNKNIHPLPPFCFHSLVLQRLKYKDKKGRQADRHIRQHDTRN